jgi:DNA-binding MarR family transcriptional regulator
MAIRRPSREELAEIVLSKSVRRHSTATVLLHHAVADRLGLGPTDHKCLDLLQERPTSGSELAARTGLTTGAITGVVARLERAGYLHREPDPWDGRRQILSAVPERLNDVAEVLQPIRGEMAALLDEFDSDQLVTIATFLNRASELAHRHAALLRAPSPDGEAPRRGRSRGSVGTASAGEAGPSAEASPAVRAP